MTHRVDEIVKGLRAGSMNDNKTRTYVEGLATALLTAQSRVVEAAREFHGIRIISAWQSAEMVHAANKLDRALQQLDAGNEK